MTTFYFNGIVGKCRGTRDSVQKAFEGILREYASLCRRKGLGIESGIITETDSNTTTVCGFPLKSLITGIDRNDKDLRKLAFSYFTRYPAENEYEIDEVYNDDSELYERYTMKGMGADELIVPFKKGWPLFTIPVEYWLRESRLTLVSSQGKEHTLTSFHGANHRDIIHYILNLRLRQLTPEDLSGRIKAEHQYNRFVHSVGKHEVKVAPDAQIRFHDMTEDEQDIAISMIEQAMDQNMLFPTRANDGLIKKCKGKGNENTFELRKRAFGIRIYFMEHNDSLLICGIHTKAEGEGREQTADINNATHEGNKLKKQL